MDNFGADDPTDFSKYIFGGVQLEHSVVCLLQKEKPIQVGSAVEDVGIDKNALSHPTSQGNPTRSISDRAFIRAEISPRTVHQVQHPAHAIQQMHLAELLRAVFSGLEHHHV